jgi:hypothetical protein
VLTCTARSGDGHTLILTAASIGGVQRHQTLGIGSGVLTPSSPATGRQAELGAQAVEQTVDRLGQGSARCGPLTATGFVIFRPGR